MNTARKLEQRFTYADYCTWPDGERWELIGGEPYAMSPAPSVRHQRIVLRLGAGLRRAFRGGRCEVFIAPLDVKLSEEDVVQPDVAVVCDPEQITPACIVGPPRLVVEVVSPGSEQHDRLRKLRLYARFGVPEYWLVTPFPARIDVLSLDGTSYRVHGAFGRDEKVTSPAFPRLALPLKAIFDFPLTDEEQALLDLELREPPAAYRKRQSQRK